MNSIAIICIVREYPTIKYEFKVELSNSLQDVATKLDLLVERIYFHGKCLDDFKVTLKEIRITAEDNILHFDYYNSLLFVKALTGKTICIYTPIEAKIKYIKLLIQHKEGIPPNEQRILYNGTQLEDNRRISDYCIQKCSTLQLVLRLRGMISTFTTTDSNDPLNAYLMLSPFARKISQEPDREIFLKAMKAADASHTATYQIKQSDILSPALRNICIKFMKEYCKDKNYAMDYKFVLPKEVMIFLFQSIVSEEVAAQIVDQLYRLHQFPNASKIAMRYTRGPTPGCIGFHCDGYYAVNTVQLTLNNDSEYVGGQLCFYTLEKGLDIPNRPAGTLTIHPREVLHAVTTLISGERYSLFVVDLCNGLGEEDIINVTKDNINQFLFPN